MLLQLASGTLDHSWDVAMIVTPGEKMNGKFLNRHGEEYSVGYCGPEKIETEEDKKRADCHVLIEM